MLDARRDEEEVAEPQTGRLGAGTLQPGLAVGDEMEDRVVLRRQPEPPRGGQLAVAVEALDEPQIPQHFGQGVVRLGPGRLVQHGAADLGWLGRSAMHLRHPIMDRPASGA